MGPPRQPSALVIAPRPGRRRRCGQSRRPHPPSRQYGQRQGTGHARPALPTVSGAGGGGNNRAMGRTVTATSWSGGSGTATRAPGGRGERSVGWRVRVVPGLREIAPVLCPRRI